MQTGFMRALAHADEVYLGVVNRAEKLAAEDRFDTEAVVEHLESQGVEAHTAASNADLLVKLQAATLPAMTSRSRVVAFFTNGSFDGIIAKYADVAQAE